MPQLTATINTEVVVPIPSGGVMVFSGLKVVVFTLGFVLWIAEAKNYTVSPNGNDSNSGLSDSLAFKTLKKAASSVNPGDTVWVHTGRYTNTSASGSVFDISRDGTPTAWIVWKAKPGHKPEIFFNGWAGINLNASYQVLDGLIITGNNDQVTLAQAEADYAITSPDPRFNGNGISIDNRKKLIRHHHFIIRNCMVRKCGGAGISAIQSDYVTIENCKVYENAWYSRYGTSGISFLTSINFDSANGYHMIIRNNHTWNNRGLVKWKEIDKYSDGNGIIIDSDKEFNYTGKTLVYNNVSFNNGGSGIHAYKCRYVDIVNNTTYLNGQVVNYPNCFVNSSSHSKVLNNIIYASPGKPANMNSYDTNVVYDYNIYFGGLAPVVKGGHDRVLDPGM